MLETHTKQTEAMEQWEVYRDFKEFASNNIEGVDYKIISEDRNSDFVVVGIHGGQIEPGTEVIVNSIAKDNLSYYVFSGTKSDQHITSTHFDEEKCINLVSKSKEVISIHGKKGADEFIMLGGLDNELILILKSIFDLAGFKILEADSNVTGIQKNNVCNRGSSGKGLQIELSRGLRDSLVADLEKMGRFTKIIRDITS